MSSTRYINDMSSNDDMTGAKQGQSASTAEPNSGKNQIREPLARRGEGSGRRAQRRPRRKSHFDSETASGNPKRLIARLAKPSPTNESSPR